MRVFRLSSSAVKIPVLLGYCIVSTG